MEYEWKYKKLGDFVYHILPPSQIRPFLTKWLKQEWEIDRAEYPDQPWTVEWLTLLPRMEFTLEALKFSDVTLRTDLMNYKTETYDFRSSLNARSREREESMLRGVSIEPLIVKRQGLELMDGYTRYMVLRKFKQEQVFAYVGTAIQGA